MRTRIQELLKSADLTIADGGVSLTTTSGISRLTLATPPPPEGFTGPIAPYYVRTQFDHGWWAHVRGGAFGANSNRVVTLYNAGNNMVFPNGSGSSYSEYCPGGQVWHLKPLWCIRIDCFYPTVTASHNLKLSVRRSTTPTVVVQEVILLFDNPSMDRPAGGVDHWKPTHTFHLSDYDSYILEYEMIQVTNTTTGNPTNFSFHGDYIIQ